MTRLKIIHLMLVLLVVCILPDVLNANLSDLQKRYNDNRLAIVHSFETQTKPRLLEQYLDLLERTRKTAVANGQLDMVLAVKKESERVKTEKTISEEQIVKQPNELAVVQQQFFEASERAGNTQKQEILELTQAYSRALDRLKTELTRAEKIAEAVSVDKEFKKIELELAELVSESPKKVKPAKAEEPVKPSKLTNFSKPKAKKGLSDDEILGEWKLRSSNKKYVYDVSFEKIDENRFLLNTTVNLKGEYNLVDKKLVKVKKEGDNYWGITFEKKNDGFINTGQHYTGWRLLKPDDL